MRLTRRHLLGWLSGSLAAVAFGGNAATSSHSRSTSTSPIARSNQASVGELQRLLDKGQTPLEEIDHRAIEGTLTTKDSIPLKEFLKQNNLRIMEGDANWSLDHISWFANQDRMAWGPWSWES